MALKSFVTYNFFQLVELPTRPNLKIPEKIHINRSLFFFLQMHLINILQILFLQMMSVIVVLLR